MSWDFIWHTITVVISCVNFGLGVFIVVRSLRQTDDQHRNYRRFLRVAGLIFVTVALYRSVFVAKYVGGLVWFNTIFNSPFLIRCLACLAELSFIGLIAAVSLRMIRGTRQNAPGNASFGPVVAKLPYVAAACIFVAQFFAFTGLITQLQWPGAVEESLWALAFLSITPVIIVGLKHRRALPGFGVFLVMMAVWCAGYLIFQLGYALPFMYWANVGQDIGQALPPDALRHAVLGYTVTRDLSTWGGIGFFIWQTGYFSLCSWMTLVMMTTPRRSVSTN